MILFGKSLCRCNKESQDVDITWDYLVGLYIPMTSVLRGERQREIRDRKGEDKSFGVPMEGVIGVKWPQAKKCQGMLATTRSKKEYGPLDTLISDLWSPDCGSLNFFCLKSPSL